jgi:hypothetical protein
MLKTLLLANPSFFDLFEIRQKNNQLHKMFDGFYCTALIMKVNVITQKRLQFLSLHQ